MRRPLLALLLLIACDTPGHAQGPALDFTIAGITFHVSDGVTVTPAGGGFTFYLSDQTDACLALQLVPVGTATTLSLHVSPPLDATTHATVVDKATLAPGEASGNLVRATGGTQNAKVTAVSG